MKKRVWKLSDLETIWYYLSVIGSFGFWYTIKVVMKKALSERDANQ